MTNTIERKKLFTKAQVYNIYIQGCHTVVTERVSNTFSLAVSFLL